MAGLGEVCSHVGAILYALLAAVKKLNGTACTDEACIWNEPKYVIYEVKKKVSYAEGSQVAFSKAQIKRATDGCGDLPPAKIPPPTPDECTALCYTSQRAVRRNLLNVLYCL